jgi:hypothetical protein
LGVRTGLDQATRTMVGVLQVAADRAGLQQPVHQFTRLHDVPRLGIHCDGDLIDPLTNPVAHGGSAPDAFHLVIPSIPGFGFSTPVSSADWEVARTTEAFAALMDRLGYSWYGAHGGDVGAGITGRLAALHPESVIGTLVNSDRGSLGLAGDQFPIPDRLTADELAVVNANAIPGKPNAATENSNPTAPKQSRQP